MMKIVGLLLAICIILAPSIVLASAFEEHTSWQKEPLLESEKGVSLSKSVIEMGIGYRYLKSDTYFNSEGNLTDTENSPKFTQHAMDIFWRFGFTENWTFWTTMPFLWSSEDIEDGRTTSRELGDANVGALYQFYRRDDPTVSMGLGLRWKLPTGNESPGSKNENIAGTGTTDVELSYLFRGQLFENLSFGFSTGYNIRFPQTVQYLSDGNSSITNAGLDLGDEIYARVDIIGAIEMLALQVTAEYRYRFPTQIAIPEFNVETVKHVNPITGAVESTEHVLANGAIYKDWDALDPDGNLTPSSGYIFTLTPKIIFRPTYMIDVSLYSQFHIMGKNSIYLVDNDDLHRDFVNFMPMQMLGNKKGGLVIGEIGIHTTLRW
jgi:hypothetical protein